MTERMTIDELLIITKHLSKSFDVGIKILDGACPCTDGKTIIIPAELNKTMAYELLATLLHETHHIRYTDMYSYRRYDMNEVERDILNHLEDIRIDYKAIQEYPQAVELYELLYSYIFTKNADKVKAETIPQQALKHMHILAKGLDKLVYSDQAMAMIDELNLTRYIDKAKNASNTSQLVDDAKTLARELFDIMKKQKQPPQPSGGSGAGEGQKSDSNEGTPKSDEGQAPSGQGTEQPAEGKYNIADYKKQLDEAKSQQTVDKGKYDEAKSETNEARDEFVKDMDKVKAEERRQRTNLTNAKRYNRKADYTDDLQEQNKALNNADRAQARADLIAEALPEMLEARDNTEDVYNSKKAESDRTYDKANKARSKAESLEHNGEDSIDALVGVSSVGMGGFEAVDSDDWKVHSDLNIEALPEALDDIIRDFFISQRECKVISENGRRFSRRNLPRLFTDCQDLYSMRHQEVKKTRVVFLVDKSSSMRGRKERRVLEAMGSLVTSLDRVKEQDNIDVDTAVYSFNRRAYMLKDFDTSLSTTEIVDAYGVAEGGTSIVEAMDKATEYLQSQADDSDDIIILMTDGEVNSQELRQLRNSSTSDIKTLFIGIEVWHQAAKDIFGEYNITSDSNIVQLLSRALMESVQG